MLLGVCECVCVFYALSGLPKVKLSKFWTKECGGGADVLDIQSGRSLTRHTGKSADQMKSR